MTQKKRTIIALVALFLVASTSYAFLEWQRGPNFLDPEIKVVTPGSSTPEVATSTDPTPEPISSDHGYGTVVIRLNEIASFPDGLSIRPTAVLEDSRCPENARCIQAGTVRLSVRIRSAMGVSTNEFTPGKTITTESESVTLLGVSPEKRAGEQLADADYRFTFEVKKRTPPVSAGQCYVGGCSQQLCTDQPNMASTCEFRPEYACYKTARCERQASGQCGWTLDAAAVACLENPTGEEATTTE
jgi:hypothetical protein